MTPRQKGLYLVAKLYELAAEFTDAELQQISADQVRQSKTSAIQHAIAALIQLHQEPEDGDAKLMASPESSKNEIARTAEASSLTELLNDRSSFPTVADIASALAVSARPKESRDRYVGRVSRMVEAMDSRSRATFLKKIAERMNTQPSFISDWSKLIKEM